MEYLASLTASNINTKHEYPCISTIKFKYIELFHIYVEKIRINLEEAISKASDNYIQKMQNGLSRGDYTRYINLFAQSKYIGCAAAQFREKWTPPTGYSINDRPKLEGLYTVHCAYAINPSREWLVVYPNGEPCSRCSFYEKCDDIYTALCTDLF